MDRWKIDRQRARRPLTCNNAHQTNLSSADIDNVLLRLRKCACFEPKEAVDAMVLPQGSASSTETGEVEANSVAYSQQTHLCDQAERTSKLCVQHERLRTCDLIVDDIDADDSVSARERQSSKAIQDNTTHSVQRVGQSTSGQCTEGRHVGQTCSTRAHRRRRIVIVCWRGC